MIQGCGQKQTGFTIVELLIVIVIVAILASITVVAFNGVRTRAGNTARIAAASQSIKLLRAYIAANGTQPIGNGAYCLTSDNVCTRFNGAVATTDNAAMMTELRKIGTPVASVERGSSTNYGVHYDSYSPRLYDGVSAPVLVMYWLDGQNVDCGQPTVMFSSGENYIASTNRWTSTNATTTTCWVTVS